MNQIKFNESDDGVQLTNALIKFQFNRVKGTFDLIDYIVNEPIITDLFYEIKIRVNNQLQTLSSIDISQWTWEITENTNELGKYTMLTLQQAYSQLNLKYNVTLYPNSEFILFQITFQATNQPFNVIEVKPFVFKKGKFPIGLITDLKILKNDWQSWSPIEVVDLSYREKRSNCKFERRTKHSCEERPKKGDIWSHYISVIKNIQTKKQMLLGFITLADQDAQIRWKIKRKKQIESLQAICFGDSILMEKEDKFNSEILMVSFNKTPKILEEWAQITGTIMQRRTPKSIPVGWCSWYQYWKGINEEKMMTNLEAAKMLKTQIPLEYFQIDDGYEPGNAIGDWLETEPKKFPKGLKNLAQQIKAAGFKPGIWLAPFLISSNSKLYKSHKNWIIRKKNGKKIWGTWPFLGASSFFRAIFWDRVFGLDLTNTDVQSWLKNTIQTLVGDIGFEYLKIDFIYGAAIEGVRQNPKMTRIQAYRKGLEIIREAAGDGTFILGCGAPFGPSIGIVDAMRVSTDTAPSFTVPFILKFMSNLLFAKLETIPSVSSAMQQNMLRYFFHNHLWINDPDTLIIRPESGLSPNEIRFEVSAIGLLGGLLFISDNMANYTPEELKLFQILTPPSNITARPLYILEENYPSILVLDISNSYDNWKVLGVFNWSKREKSYKIDLNQVFNLDNEKFHVFEFWDRKYLGIQESIFQTEPIDRHSVKLYSIHGVSESPILLSSTFHITQGGIEVKIFDYNKVQRSLRIVLEKAGKNNGQLFIHLPPDLVQMKIQIKGKCENFNLLDYILILNIGFQDSIELIINFK